MISLGQFPSESTSRKIPYNSTSVKYSADISKQAWSSVIDIFIWDKKLDLLFIHDQSPHFNRIKQVIAESCC